MSARHCRLPVILLAAVFALAAGAPQDLLPPSGSDAAARIADSPRHGEWVTVDAGGDPVSAWVVYPERSDPAPVVVVIHEIYGLTGWIRSVADSLAAAGFIAIAPDLLSGKGPDGGGTDSLDQPVRAIRDLDPAEVKRRLDAVAEYGLALPAAADRFGVVGYCWGGSTSFAYAAQQPEAAAAVVYYGSSPAEDMLRQLRVPVLGLYGGDDERVNATIGPARDLLEETGARYETEIYEGAGHGFLRSQDHEERGVANRRATAAAWARTIAFFRQNLER